MTTTHHDTEIAPELAGLGLVDKPDGPGAAAMVAAGFGIFVLGLLTTLNEMSEAIHSFLDAFDGDFGVGPLSGKTTVATIAFFVSWVVLGGAWRRKNVDLKKSFWWGLALGVVGTVLMFPPLFQAFAS
ncbi:MAG TPA: hypothetical protein VJR05_13875 [Acidimicrobiia bacterium]|nr:hypothetical protein [Acidimicrobiia bacterium]